MPTTDYQVQRSVLANTAGFTDVWVPNPVKRVRLLSAVFSWEAGVSLSKNPVVVSLYLDGGTAVVQKILYLPATPLAVTVPCTRMFFGPGRVSAAPGTSVRVHLSKALTTGSIRVVAMGGEE